LLFFIGWSRTEKLVHRPNYLLFHFFPEDLFSSECVGFGLFDGLFGMTFAMTKEARESVEILYPSLMSGVEEDDRAHCR
jgi:hypothetical protein